MDLLESIFEKCEIDPEKIGGLIDEYRKRNVELPFSELGELLQRYKKKQEEKGEKEQVCERRVIDVAESAKSMIEKAQRNEGKSLPKRYFSNLIEERKEEETVNLKEKQMGEQAEKKKEEPSSHKESNRESGANLERKSPRIEQKQSDEELKKSQFLLVFTDKRYSIIRTAGNLNSADCV